MSSVGISVHDLAENGDLHTPSEAGSSDDDHGITRKRKRPMNVTCEACKARKVRCDRAQPQCGWCSRNDHVCEYKERKKPGLRAGYGRELESRLERLELQMEEQTQLLSVHLANGCTDLYSPHPPEQLRNVSTQRQAHLEATATLQELRRGNPHARQDDVGIGPPLQQPLPPKAFPQLRAAEPRSAQAQNHYTPSAQSLSLTSPIPATGYSVQNQAANLPPHDLLYTLVDLFFQHINCWFPLLERKTTLDRLFGSAALDEADQVLLHALVTVSLRFCNDARLTPESKQHYYQTSKQRVQLFGLENSSVRSLQALTILALDVNGATNGPPGWNLISLISRSMVQLGLAAETTSTLTASKYPSIATLRAAVLPEPEDFIEDEERRRLFWSAYVLDRLSTIATSFEFALDDKDIDRRLPCRDDLFANNRAVETQTFQASQSNAFAKGRGSTDFHGPFSSLIEIFGILSAIHRFLRRPIDIGSINDIEQWQGTYRRLDGELGAWHFNLPDEFSNLTRLMKSRQPSSNASVGWITVHAAYCLAVIRLNSSAAYPSQTSPLFSSSYSAMQRCLSAVDSVRELAHLVQISGLLDKLGPPFAFCVWVCARVTFVHGSTMDHEIDPDLDTFVSILSDMGAHWDVSRRYAEILHRVFSEYQQSRRAAVFGGERSTPSTVQILSDMRRCAYDLDFLISRQPHNAVRSYHPTRSNTPKPNELEYLDVFDLFNFPRLHVNGQEGGDGGNGTATMQQASTSLDSGLPGMDMLPNFAVPNPDEDWLFHAQ